MTLVVALGLAACGADSSSDDESTQADDPSLCEVLSTELFEVRRAALSDAESSVRQEADADCPEDVERVEAAVQVMEDADSLDAGQFEVSIGDTCVVGANGVFQATLAIRAVDSPIPGSRNLGVAGTVRLVRDGEDIAGNVGEFFDFSTLTSGASSPTTTHIQGRLPTDAASNLSGVTCRISGDVYLSHAGQADAALDEPLDAAQADDDPAVWFSALVEAERQWRAADDSDLVATTVDLRNPHYLDLVADTNFDGGAFDGQIDPCFATDGFDDKMEITYAATIDGQSTMYFLVFRRASDGAWLRVNDPHVLGAGVGCEAIQFLYEHRESVPLD